MNVKREDVKAILFGNDIFSLEVRNFRLLNNHKDNNNEILIHAFVILFGYSIYLVLLHTV